MLKVFSWLFTANASRQVTFLTVNLAFFERLSRRAFGDLALAFSYVTVFIDRQHTLLVVNSCTLFVSITLGWWATAGFGITGMATSVAITEAMSLTALIATYWGGLRRAVAKAPTAHWAVIDP